MIRVIFLQCIQNSTNLTINEKIIDGMLGTRILGSMMVGEDESTELWWHPYEASFSF